MDIVETTVFVTSDGERHLTRQMAERHVLRENLREMLRKNSSYDNVEVGDVIELIDQNRSMVRAYLDATDVMVKGSLT